MCSNEIDEMRAFACVVDVVVVWHYCVFGTHGTPPNYLMRAVALAGVRVRRLVVAGLGVCCWQTRAGSFDDDKGIVVIVVVYGSPFHQTTASAAVGLRKMGVLCDWLCV